MKNVIIFFILISVVFGCKKKTAYQACANCSCFNLDTFNIAYTKLSGDTGLDSAALFQSLLGRWNVMQRDTFDGPFPGVCVGQCYCDSQYYVVFLPNDSVIVNLPHVGLNTYFYGFWSNSGGYINPQQGYIYYPGNLPFLHINYAGNYLGFTTVTATPGTLIYPPNYYLIRQ
jgi:hypothetical protein